MLRLGRHLLDVLDEESVQGHEPSAYGEDSSASAPSEAARHSHGVLAIVCSESWSDSRLVWLRQIDAGWMYSRPVKKEEQKLAAFEKLPSRAVLR